MKRHVHSWQVIQFYPRNYGVHDANTKALAYLFCSKCLHYTRRWLVRLGVKETA